MKIRNVRTGATILAVLAVLLVAQYALQKATLAQSRATVQALGIMTLLVTLVYGRSLFGVAFGLLFGAVLYTAGRHLKQDNAALLLSALGVTSALYALLDIRSDVLLQPGAVSDAAMLAELTGIPALLWGLLWGGIALAACGLMLRRLWLRGG